MLVKPRDWFSKLVSVRGSTFRATWPKVAVCTGLSLVVTAAEMHFQTQTYSLKTTPFVLMGVALSILLGFMNSAVYDRWWEGRKLWGRMVNVARTFARQTLVFLDASADWDARRGRPHAGPHHDAADGANGHAVPDGYSRIEPASGRRVEDKVCRDLVVRGIAYVHAVRHHLRDDDPGDDLRRLLPREEADRLAARGNVPIALLEEIGRRLRDAYRAGRLTDYQFVALEASLLEMTSVQGGCERIKNTPMPMSYTVLVHRLVAFYCFTLPFGLVSEVGWMTPIVVLLITQTFYGLDAVGEELEEPFGFDQNDLPLEALCRTIESNLWQSLGDEGKFSGSAERDGVVV